MKKTNEDGAIGILVPSLTNPFFPLAIKSIQQFVGKTGRTTMLSDTNVCPEMESKLCQDMINRGVEGIISFDPSTDNMSFFELISMETPMVLVNAFNQGVRCHFVLNDQVLGTEKALEYLIGLGHHNIAFIRGAKSYSYDIKERVFLDTLKNNGLVAQTGNIITIPGGNTEDTTNQAFDAVLMRLLAGSRPTAFFACNDLMAIGALNAAKHLDIPVPDQLSIIGYDNLPESEFTNPKLTTVDQNMSELGEQAAKLLCQLIESHLETFVTICVENTLVIRESCALSPEI